MTLLFAASVSVFAAGDGLTYKVTGEDTACVSNAYEVRSNYVVADKITSEGKEYTVNEIKWIECRNVKSIVVPETVTILGNEALGYYWGAGLVKAKDCVIYSYRGTVTEEYCKKNGITFAAILRDGETPVWSAMANSAAKVRLDASGKATISVKAFLNEYDYNGLERPDLESKWYKVNDGNEVLIDAADGAYDGETGTSSLTVDAAGEYKCILTEKGTDLSVSVPFTVQEAIPIPVSITYNANNEYEMFFDEAQKPYTQYDGSIGYSYNTPDYIKTGDTITVVYDNGSEGTYTYDANEQKFTGSDSAVFRFEGGSIRWKKIPDTYEDLFVLGGSYQTTVDLNYKNEDYSKGFTVDAFYTKLVERPYAVVNGIRYEKIYIDEDYAWVAGPAEKVGNKVEIPATVTLNDNKEYQVSDFKDHAFTDPQYSSDLRELTILGRNTWVNEQAVGYLYDEETGTSEKVEGITIYGYRGSSAEYAANMYKFTFVPLDPEVFDLSAGAEVAVSAGGLTYTGKALEPEVTVTYKGKALVKDTDYTLAYENNTNAGTAKVVVTGTGSYTGTAEGSFTIEKAANPLAVKAKTYSVKYAILKKKAQVVAISKVVS